MSSASMEFEVIIIGAGPAGLCAAMYCGRGMLRTVVLERGAPGGELLNTEKVEDYPGFISILGPDLADKMADHARHFGADIRTEDVVSIARDADGIFQVTCSGGAVYTAPAVILTAGGTPNKLDVAGELEYAGRGVSYCAVCDGAFFKGDTIAVIGGGDAAVEEADYLTRYAAKVYIVHRRHEFRAAQIVQDRAMENPRIEVLWNRRVLEMVGDVQGLKHLRLEDTVHGGASELPVTGAFIFIGFTPNSGLIKHHFTHDAAGYIVTNDRMETSIPGLFAAGDLRVQLTRQVTTAVGDATTAAIAVEKYLTARRAAPLTFQA
ncbi:MAG TPA: thioredoxin-disulfide reductase [Gemmatimonadales bacterium]|jgi:thioredoxin reductase (NADPH)|nr:thioredoxin-disulfide reductase [Gemmatimonadales bacterium]